jgi:hypothetical protein
MSDEMPEVIYTMPEQVSSRAGTYCDVDDGGVKYVRAAPPTSSREGFGGSYE